MTIACREPVPLKKIQGKPVASAEGMKRMTGYALVRVLRFAFTIVLVFAALVIWLS